MALLANANRGQNQAVYDREDFMYDYSKLEKKPDAVGEMDDLSVELKMKAKMWVQATEN